MTEYCRLCAELKESDEIVASIDDAEQSTEEKLWACCQWTHENNEHRLPHSVCSICFDKLEKSWLFAQSVQLAQQRLLAIFENESVVEAKPLITVVVPPSYDDALTQTNHILPTVIIPFETTSLEFNYSEYHPIEGDASGQLDEFNDLNGDVFSEYFEENKNDILSIQTDDQTDNVPKTTQAEAFREHKCTDCDQQFPTKSSLKNHRAVLKCVRSYECWLCHKIFRRKYHLSKHLLAHTRKERINLDRRLGNSSRRNRPQQPTSRRGAKKTCIRSAYTPKYRRFSCDDRSNIENLLDYKLSELLSFILTDEEQHEKVNKTRSTRSVFNDSKQLPPFRCEECGKEFNLRRGLLAHRRTVHTIEEPIECEHCGKFFKHAHSLRRHRQLFSIDLPLTKDTCGFACDDCGRTFVRQLWLLKHRLSHSHTTAKRSHQTTANGLGDVVKRECGHSITGQPPDLSNDRRFECWLCHEMFTGKPLLERHFAVHMMSPELRRLKAELIYHHC